MNRCRLSLRTAMTLFQAKVLHTLTYWLDLIWDNLTVSDLNTIESVKARYLKRILGISKTAPSRLPTSWLKNPSLSKNWDSKCNYHLRTQKLQSRLEKLEMIELEFYSTVAMINRSWEEPNNELRSPLTRLAIHGFHHKTVQPTLFPWSRWTVYMHLVWKCVWAMPFQQVF